MTGNGFPTIVTPLFLVAQEVSVASGTRRRGKRLVENIQLG
jgi:hypothetical protein